jgi:hypothetical protein
MALNKLKFNSINVTPAAGEAIRFNSSANGLETASAGGSLVKIASTTASSSSSLSFTSGIDSTYKEYIFFFNNIHASTQAHFQVNFSADGGSNYNVTKTTTFFFASHNEAGDSTSLSYQDSHDITGTGAHSLGLSFSSDNDAGGSGYMHLFDPSSTTFVKHFIAVTGGFTDSDYYNTNYTAGYGNTTSAVDAVQFSMASGNIDAGTITMYGVT